MQTGCPGVFAGGDMVPYARTVTTAVGHGKAAQHIDAWLRRETRSKQAKHEIATFEMLRLWYHAEAKARSEHDRSRAEAAHVRRGGRRARFDRGALRSAALPVLRQLLRVRWVLLGVPRAGVIKLGPGRRYEYDLNKCTGCAICYDQCPCGAITMIPEPVETAAADV